MRRNFFIFVLILFSAAAFSVRADVLGDQKNFYIDSGYDSAGRKELNASLIKKTEGIYFYADKNWWNSADQESADMHLSALAKEFKDKIHPALVSAYGEEPNPGIDNDSNLTILIHPMKKVAGGYFRSNDEYSKILVPDSNEREMIYLNSEYISSPSTKGFLAHEFTHLITFNQKENRNNVTEDVWLNELRAEYAPTLLGYDDIFENSNLKSRMDNFLENPSESLTNWRSDKSNYGSINLFAQYLVEQYGMRLLADSLHSNFAGIDSINYALQKEGYRETFASLFKNWVIAVLINNCAYGEKYCYANPFLKDFHVLPNINFLPLSGESTLSFSDTTSQWAGNWYKIIGGKGDLNFNFNGSANIKFSVPYIVQSKTGNLNINFLVLDENNAGQILIENFGNDASALYIIPFIFEAKDTEPFYSFSWSVSNKKNSEDPELINSLLAQIAKLKTQIEAVQAQIAAISGKKVFCSISNNLFLGQKNEDVECLQRFLVSQGTDIYPERLVTGYFGILTKFAVMRLQAKYGISKTGYVGPITRAKINQLLTI